MPVDVCAKSLICNIPTITNNPDMTFLSDFIPEVCPMNYFCIYGTSFEGDIQPFDCIPGTICLEAASEPSGNAQCQPG